MTAPRGPVPEDEAARDPMLERLDAFVGVGRGGAAYTQHDLDLTYRKAT
jgi:hypothetical protein